MVIDFDKWEEMMNDNGWEYEETIAGFHKLKSFSEEEINAICEALEAAIDDEWTKMIDNEIDAGGIPFNSIKDEPFTKQYFEEYPEEKKCWDEHNEYNNDLFIDFLKKHDYIDDVRQVVFEQCLESDSWNTQFPPEYRGGNYAFHARDTAIEIVSKNTKLPYEILNNLLDYKEGYDD